MRIEVSLLLDLKVRVVTNEHHLKVGTQVRSTEKASKDAEHDTPYHSFCFPRVMWSIRPSRRFCCLRTNPIGIVLKSNGAISSIHDSLRSSGLSASRKNGWRFSDHRMESLTDSNREGRSLFSNFSILPKTRLIQTSTTSTTIRWTLSLALLFWLLCSLLSLLFHWRWVWVGGRSMTYLPLSYLHFPSSTHLFKGSRTWSTFVKWSRWEWSRLLWLEKQSSSLRGGNEREKIREGRCLGGLNSYLLRKWNIS